MNCAQAEERLMLRLYDELPLDEASSLDAHLAACENCRRELAALRALGETLSHKPVVEPPANLLAETRRGLSAALDAEAQGRWFPRIFGAILPTPQTMPFAIAAMLFACIGAGGIGGYRLGIKAHPGSAASITATTQLMPQAGSPIASVSSVAPQPDGSGIVVRYNRLVPESATGSADDPAIRQLLAMGIQTPTGPEVQDDSVRLLADACTHGPRCDDSRVRAALMTAARYDGDANLRAKALAGLEPYIALDTRVRDAVLESVMHDSSPEIRAQAVDMLSPVEADSSVQQVLHNASMSDQSPRVRSMSRTMARDANDVGLQIQ